MDYLNDPPKYRKNKHLNSYEHGKIVELVQNTILKLINKAGDCFSKVFKSFTCDNGF